MDSMVTVQKNQCATVTVSARMSQWNYATIHHAIYRVTWLISWL